MEKHGPLVDDNSSGSVGLAAPFHLGIIGGGAMATALLKGILDQGSLNPSQIAVSEPDPHQRRHLAETLGVSVFAANALLVNAHYLILAIKPQVFAVVQAEIAPLLAMIRPAPIIVSIMAGIPLARLEDAFPGLGIVRTMPNTPALVGAGITALSHNAMVSERQLAEVADLFRCVGEVISLPEHHLDAVTAVSGSGPGYVALFMEAMMDGAVQAGLSRSVARQLVLATFKGTAVLCESHFASPALLKDQVTSPGGTTIAGLAELEKAGVRGAIMAAITAAQSRSQAIAQLD